MIWNLFLFKKISYVDLWNEKKYVVERVLFRSRIVSNRTLMNV